jgi:hypothetical protein
MLRLNQFHQSISGHAGNALAFTNEDITMSSSGTVLIAAAAILAGGACAHAAVSPGKSAYFHPICQEAVKAANGMAAVLNPTETESRQSLRVAVVR